MLVTHKELRFYGLKQNPRWFSYHFKNIVVGFKPGIMGLENLYNVEDIKHYIDNYLKRLEKMPHISRHNSKERCENLLKAIRSLECNQLSHQ